MDRVPVRSSNLKSVGYDPESQDLEVEFHGGRIYVYFGVPSSVAEGLMAASSKGSFHASRIKDRYRYRRIR